MSRPAFRATALLGLFLLLAGSASQSQVFTPEGPHCVRPEVIVTQKNGKQFCVNPHVPWVKRVFQEMFNKRNNRL